MIQPAIYDFPTQKRLTRFEGVRLKLKKKGTDDPIADITGYKIECWVREKTESGKIVKKFSTDDATIEITDGPNAQFDFKPFDILFNPEIHHHDVYFTNESNEAQCYLKGKWNIEKNITGSQKA